MANMSFLEVILSTRPFVQCNLITCQALQKTKENTTHFTVAETVIRLVIILSEVYNKNLDLLVFSIISSLVTSGIILRIFCSRQEK